MPFSKAKQIILPAGLSADLDWKAQELLAFQESSVLWHLDFSFSSMHFSPQDFLKNQSYLIAIEHFGRTIWNDFKKNTTGVVLYQGATDFSRIFPKELWLESFVKWLDLFIQNAADRHELKGASSSFLDHYYELYAAKLFAEVMQRLLVFLPEECAALLLIEAKEPLAFLAQKFSLECFESFVLLDLKKNQLPFLNQKARLGICLPPDSHCDQEMLAQINAVLNHLKQQQIDFRCIPESKLSYFWNGLDTILVFSRTLSNQGKRQLLGFCATGGRVVVEGEGLCLPQEVSMLNFLQIF
ncbi:hypothetical protein [Candidatus Rhabdochlamydia sp. T3358]|uniref:hypothetical protein n=1 Tax=Candidatus Rhabdochlamydia sp. T3358 TaxID=2099795 RepID=UPI0010B5F2F7|nr:hypothetical protein [Candidatus Rhabdochlamydia sp. T3358]VHO02686.1 hypothetical protein RHT_00622 [Candidatus Rhabdochlamydia sp. T3358]